MRNTELRPDGKAEAIEGSATEVPGSGRARLRVRFGGRAALAPVPIQRSEIWQMQHAAIVEERWQLEDQKTFADPRNFDVSSPA